FQCLLFESKKVQALLHFLALEVAGDPAGDYTGDHRRRQFAQVAEQYLAMLIEFANNPRTPLQRHIVKLPGELVLDNASLLLHYQDLVQALSEIPGSDRLQWPGHSHLEDA